MNLRKPRFEKQNIWIPIAVILGCAMMVPMGCRQKSERVTKSPQQGADCWTIIGLREERGRDTMQTDDGQMYHNYFCAVVFENNGEQLSLVYVNSLPAGLELNVGQTYEIAGLDKAKYADDWNGYWLHDVTLKLVAGE
jgi:hypothetical protein